MRYLTFILLFVISLSKNQGFSRTTDSIEKISVSVKNFGAHGDGTRDDTEAIQNALNFVEKIGGGDVIIPTSTGPYLLSETIYIGNNTRLIFEESFLKLMHYTSIGTIIRNRRYATNIEIINPLLDGNNIYAGGTGENGISIIEGGTITVKGGVIKNCKKGVLEHRLGGKGIQVENKSVLSFVASGIKILNCSIALSTQYDIEENLDSNVGVNVVFQDIYAENCGIFMMLIQVNGIQETSTKHNVKLLGFTTVNCGYDDGVFVFSRARGFQIIDGSIRGDLNVRSIFRGRHSAGLFERIKISQPSEAIIDLEPSFHSKATTRSQFNKYSLLITASTNCILRTSPNYNYSNRELFDSSLQVILEKPPISCLVSPQAISVTSNVDIQQHDKCGRVIWIVKGNMLHLHNAGILKI